MALETKGPGNDDIDTALVVVGTVNLRKTHPNLYRATTLLSVLCVLLGLNFVLLHPTFLILDQSNYLWGAIFLALGAAQLVLLNVWRRLRLLRASTAVSAGYFCAMGLGTTQPFFEGQGSLQLPILYLAVAVIYLPLLAEPFINPWTAEREP